MGHAQSRRPPARWGPALAALAVVVATGLVHGAWTDRWAASGAVEEAAARLGRAPMTVGDWEGQPLEFDLAHLMRFGFAGGLSRRYVNRRTGDAVQLMLVCGRPGPMAVHTPEVCFPGAGYVIDGDRARSSVDLGPAARPAEIWALRASKPSPAGPGPSTAIAYAWSATGDWQAPAGDARLTFAPYPFLYKMYALHEPAPAPGDGRDDGRGADATIIAFLRRLIPELRPALFPNG